MKLSINRAMAHSFLSKTFCSAMIAVAIVSFVSCEKENDDNASGNCTISVSANPAEGGTVTQSGTGTYLSGTSCTVTATANSGYNFVNWTENGTEVSTDATYQFSVTANHTLVANFTQTSSGAETGVVIKGVTWATRNVDAPGTFAATPESAGMFYQWGSNVGWSSVDPLSATDGNNTWRDLSETGNEWQAAKDPCPSGWRVPTYAEQRSLLNSGSSWTTQNGVTGRVFGSGSNTLFLPAAGCRYSSLGGTLDSAGAVGDYWSSTQPASYSAFYLYFYSGDAGWNGSGRSFGFSVRCVQE
jgi:uncharacterized protein (TIGR02145 family)